MSKSNESSVYLSSRIEMKELISVTLLHIIVSQRNSRSAIIPKTTWFPGNSNRQQCFDCHKEEETIDLSKRWPLLRARSEIRDSIGRNPKNSLMSSR